MPTPNAERIEALFLAVAERPPGERDAFLRAACGDDTLMLEEVRALLRHDREEDGLLAPLVLRPGTDADAAQAAPALPTRIGRYRIVRELGLGGMGCVYEAEQSQPQRAVAVKVLRPGVGAQQLLRRFEREAELLARLRHPNIAHVYEAGVAALDDGGPVPFIAMELVRGSPLLDYATAQQLDARQRLELIADIGDAVHHAHAHGVIHRDLKPANILVEQDGTPRILDFGVARVTDADLHTVTLQTDVGQLVGTVPYMSPEQVTGNPEAVDARTDVYALGVLLFELITGRLPHDILGRSLPDAVRMIREDEPSRLRSLVPRLRGDVETIVATALEKNSERRYQSAAALAADIRRYLRHEPIAARPAGTFYQLRKFARRNTGLVTGVAAAFVALLVGLIGMSMLSYRLAEQRDRAEQALVRAEREAAKYAAINAFFTDDLLAAVDPGRARGEELTMRQVLDAAAATVGAFVDQPEVEISVRTTIGQLYRRLSRFPDAEPHLQRAVERARETQGDMHPATALALVALGELYADWGRLNEAERLFREAYAIQSQAAEVDPAAFATTVYDLAFVLSSAGRRDEVEAWARRAVELRRTALGDQHTDYAEALDQLAYTLVEQNKLDEAEPLYREALAIKRTAWGDDHLSTIGTRHNLASLTANRGRLDDAINDVRPALDAARRTLGDEHWITGVLSYQLAGFLSQQDQWEAAEPLARAALENRIANYGQQSHITAASMIQLARILHGREAHGEAVRYARRALETLRDAEGPAEELSARARTVLTDVLIDIGAFTEAEEIALYNLRHYEKREAGPDLVRLPLEQLHRLYEAWNRPADATRIRARLTEMAGAAQASPRPD